MLGQDLDDHPSHRHATPGGCFLTNMLVNSLGWQEVQVAAGGGRRELPACRFAADFVAGAQDLYAHVVQGHVLSARIRREFAKDPGWDSLNYQLLF